MSLSKEIQKTQRIFNKYIRLRDSKDGYFKCISCGQIKPVSQMQAGHYYPAGQYSSLRFDEDNVHGECIACNYYSGDHLIGYRKNLEKKIGKERLEKLDLKAGYSKSHYHKWSILELEVIRKEYKEKIKKLLK